MTSLIGFAGPSGCGKDVAAERLERYHDFCHFKFSDAMKDGLKAMFGLSEAQVNGDARDIKISEYGKTPREMLQSLGTEWGQDMIHPKVWTVKANHQWIHCKNNNKSMTISDVRFDYQADWIREVGGVIVHIDDLYERKTLGHSSEDGVAMINGDCQIINDRKAGFTLYYHKLDTMVAELNGKKEIPTPVLPELTTYSMKPDTAHISEIIREWADGVFPERTIMNAISKLVLEEIPEFLMDRSDAMELADCGILLYDIAHLAGIDLDAAMRTKMEINKKRKWQHDTATGLMNHIKETADE